ncbi:cation transporter [Pseudomonas sp. V1]|uniref:cation transporter n=1 Tax=Pseudomonas arcuscaelestis TaxID=2710591 RepID=UPI00193FA5DD|nr:cation transporter [Pseudomonas arcuscaelestis]MBM3105842.1 cation transporter [Pseudomonas arcuscaelestis]
MSESKHRLGVSETNLVARHLKLAPQNLGRIGDAIKEIDNIYGMDAVSFDEKSQVLNLAYDASRVGIECVEEVLSQFEIEVSHDWWTHFKEGHYRFVDQNVKDNAAHQPWSCHRTSPRTKRRP